MLHTDEPHPDEPITRDPASGIRDPDFESRTIARVLWRLIPFIILLQFLNYLDRVNVSFAKLTMSQDLGFSEAVYGFGAGIFFVSYFIFEIPSNLILDRVGARLWMARIMITWGVISSLMMCIKGTWSFYLLRFLLGAAEAGFAPGILLYFTYWIPVRLQARAVAWFLTATAFSGCLGSPLAGWLLRLDGVPLFGHPLAGWQWLFLLEGIPSVLAGIAVLVWLTDRPEHAQWLTPEQREKMGDGPGALGPPPGMRGGPGGGAGRRVSPERLEALKEHMTPEQQQKFDAGRKRMQERRGRFGGGPGGGRGPGGMPPGPPPGGGPPPPPVP